jgi:hypothetical protein
MPYITQERRKALQLKTNKIETAGELNFLFTVALIDSETPELAEMDLRLLINDYLTGHDLSYQVANDIIGALICCAFEASRRLLGKVDQTTIVKIFEVVSTVAGEFYKTLVAPYEDGKLEENGDVFVYQKLDEFFAIDGGEIQNTSKEWAGE